MSLPIWTPAALSSEAAPWKGRGWRLVEAQHRISTLKLVDTIAEQALLEDILEDTKPPVPEPCRGLDYLLSTPFRYDAPYPHGSRFRRAGMTPGVFYASEHVETALAEMVFYRFLFYAESPETPWPDNPAEYTALAVKLAVTAALDLTRGALARDAALWTDPVDYAACQALEEAAREGGIGLIRYASVRDPGAGMNLALLGCEGFAAPAPVARQSWHIRLGPLGAQALSEHPGKGLSFPREAFGGDPRLAEMKWER